MSFHLTGHHEIDYQHSLLNGLLGRLARFCPIREVAAGKSCGTCPSVERQHCLDTLAQLTGEIQAFLVGHANYEERLMSLLPRTPLCTKHIKHHTQSHRDILVRLDKISASGDNVSPQTKSARLHQAIQDWMLPHTSDFDSQLTENLLDAVHDEMNYDGQLVHILDEFVFHHRPKQIRFLPAQAESAAQLSVRSALDSLTSRQREVCQLITLGRSNKAMADLLGTTVNTIKTHRTQVFRKMGVSSVLDLVRKVDLLRSSQREKPATNASHGTRAGKLSGAGLRALRILVIEHSRSLRGSVVAGLNALGHKASGATRSDCMGWLARNASPDLVLIGMEPACNPSEVARLLVGLRAESACSVYVADSAGKAGQRRRIRADGYLAWPPDFAELSAVVGRLSRHPD
jgi:DNA-binding NarL/FixJ family response regulator